MQLSVKDLSRLLKVTERTIYRWIKQQSIPVYRIHDQYRFNRVEILDWAAERKINVSQEILHDADNTTITAESLAETIKKGGIFYRVEGNDKKTLLSSVVALLNLPEDVNRQDLLNAMLYREELGSTGIGEGIAIPHVRYPVITHIQDVIVSICFTEQAVNFEAIDGKPVRCLFTIVSPTVRGHLKIISRISYVIQNPGVKAALLDQKSRETILSEIDKIEQKLENTRQRLED